MKKFSFITFSFITVIIFLAFIVNANSQFISGQKDNVIVKGQVVDVKDRLPIGCEITIMDGKKKVKFTSDDKTGAFQRIMKLGVSYPIIISGKKVLRSETEIRVDKKDNNSEATLVIKATRLYSGLSVDKYMFFSKNSASLVPSSSSLFKEIQKTLRFNRAIKVKFAVGSADSYPSDNAQAKKLRADRMKTMNDLLQNDRSWKRYKKRITVTEDPSTSNSNQNLNIIVKSFEDIFK